MIRWLANAQSAAIKRWSPQTQRAARSCAALPRAAHYPLSLPPYCKAFMAFLGFWRSASLRSAICPLRTGLSPSPCAGGSARKPYPVAGFGCKVFKYLLGPRETLQDRPGSNLISTRRFTRMAGRNSRYHHTLKRGLEQCSPTLKSATFSLSISSLRN
jgi:hypothetical protein